MSRPGAGPRPFVSISNEQIYTQILELRRAVDGQSGNPEKLADHESRLRSMERRWYQMPASLIGFGAGVADLIVRMVHGG